MTNSTDKTLPLWHVVRSVLASFLGVQRSNIAEQDFAHGNAWMYVITGIVAVVLFVATIWSFVKWVLR